MKFTSTFILLFALSNLALLHGRQEIQECGTHNASEQQEAFLHRQLLRQRKTLQKRSVSSAAVQPDRGQIAVLEGVDGVVSTRNHFSLQDHTIRFMPVQPNASAYQFAVTGNSYEEAAASAGQKLDGLNDDDSRYIDLPFAFPFFGSTYQRLSVNSDGNLTFGTVDNASTDRSLGRLTAGPPRIAPLFRDLDPTRSTSGVRVLSETDRLVVSWVAVPEYGLSGAEAVLTFQVRLYPDGRIEFAYTGNTTQSAVVGISPGGLTGSVALLSFVNTASAPQYTGPIAELFTGQQELDIVLASQNFFVSHEDSYDYLVLFNTMGVAPCPPSAIACENTVQKLMQQTGYGNDDEPSIASEFGSKRRLQAVLNMGTLDQYPAGPNTIATISANPYNTPVKIIGHEAGHLFLSYASVRDPGVADQNSLAATPMLGRSAVHWAFTFNSEASLLEGNRISDSGASVSPRFLTVAAAEGYSPFDQYLMGFRPPEEVPPSLFYVTGSGQAQDQAPRIGVRFNGIRRDVSMQDLISTLGRRTPDSTVAQRRFRFAFVLVVALGTQPTAAQLAKLDSFRTAFELAYPQYADGRATADTTLGRSLGLSLFPAAGVVSGHDATATLTLEHPAEVDLTVAIKTTNGVLNAPTSITIPEGASQASFSVTGLRAGVEELTLTPSDDQYEAAFARVQVLSSSDGLRLMAPDPVTVPGPVAFHVVDNNQLPYPNVRVSASVATGSVIPSVTATDAQGFARFHWLTSGRNPQQLTAALADSPATAVTITATPSVLAASMINAVVNAASYVPGGSPGAIGTIFGTGLTGTTQLLLNNRPVRIFYNNDIQINFLIPADTPLGTVNVSATTAQGATPVFPLTLTSTQPGIFYDSDSGYGAVLVGGALTQQTAAKAGDVLEVYATGLGPLALSGRGLSETENIVQALVGGQTAPVLYSGAAPGFPGLYQVNVQVPGGAGTGAQDLTLVVNGAKSNTVRIRLK